MNENIVQDELIKRYTYLYNNKELILALCIRYDYRRKYYKKELKETRKNMRICLELIKKAEDDSERNSLISLNKLQKSSYKSTKEEIDTLRPYLFKDVSSEIVDAFEEFLFTDEEIENTVLYKHVEALKNNPLFYEQVMYSINLLENRRNRNVHLAKIPTFTVWKILSYVRKRNQDNACALEALEKYYNIDRYMLTGVDFDSGYKLLRSDEKTSEKMSMFPDSTIYTSVETKYSYSGVMWLYQGNEYEEEDNYSAYAWSFDFLHEPEHNFAWSNFMGELASMPMISEELKSELYQNLNYSKALELKK